MKITARVGLKGSGKEIPQPPLGSTSLYLKSHELSTKEFLNILFQLEPKQYALINFIEGLDGGLHSLEQVDLIEKIKCIKSDGHLIFTTYSFYTIDALDVSQVEVWYKGKYKLLSEHPDVEWGKQTLTTGEFCDAEGEEWVSK